jgi:hypothetical protein
MWGGFTDNGFVKLVLFMISCSSFTVEELVQVGQERAIFLLKFYFAAFLWGIQNIFFFFFFLGLKNFYFFNKIPKKKKKKKKKNCSLYIKDSGLHFGEVGVIGACILARKLAFIKLNI